MKTIWTAKRLERLYARYNCHFWKGRLPHIPVRIAQMDGLQGLYEEKPQRITLDIKEHKSDREVRGTLLHEMAHAAAGEEASEIHGSKFWSQIEHLLRQNAPITVGFPETPDLRILKDAIPRRFPLACGMVNKAHERHQQEVEKQARKLRKRGFADRYVRDEDIVQHFRDAAVTLTWSSALPEVGLEYGLIDVAPANKWSLDIIAKGRSAHRRARAQVLAERRLEAKLRNHR